MVRRCHGPLGVANLEAALAEPGERLGARHLVHEVEIHGQQRRRALILRNDVVVPDLFYQGSRLAVHRVQASSSTGSLGGERVPAGGLEPWPRGQQVSEPLARVLGG